MDDLKKPVLWLVILVVILACWGLLARYIAGPTTQKVSTSSNPAPLNAAYVPPQPPPTPADTVTALQNDAFQFLVSYADTGFEPRTIAVKKGDTVRFTNNSTTELWIADSGSALYPAARNGCGSSALDSCGPLDPGRYWQFTFTQKGTWDFTNNLDKSKTGIVVVQVQ